MTGPLDIQDNASTPLTEEEREGLIPSYITLRHELNDAEQANILESQQWALSRKRNVANETRQRYIAALRSADQHDMQPLLDFVRS